MKKLELLPEKISSILAEKLSTPDCIFVFPTDTVMNSWIDWIVLNPSKSGCEAIPFERFIAWDNFKGTYVAAEQTGKSVIPSILRKFFVSDLIARNALKPEAERLQVLINPSDEYAKNASSFEDWIAKNISSLHFWKKRLDKNASEYGELDAEDKDYLYIYDEYSRFLNANNLFEPSWVEGTDISDKKTEFIIFYPELLEDFGDFEEIFEANENITLYTLPETLPAPKVYKYSDSRKELRQTMLRIIKLVNEGHADWSEIALSVPDIDTYRPYLDREFSLYGIPYVIKAGEPLTKNCAGRIFREIYECHNSGFSFDSVRALLLDECVPWKSELTETKEALIREGNRMRCLCSPGEKDIWQQCFASKLKRLELAENFNNTDSDDSIKYFDELKEFYSKLHSAVESFFNSENHSFYDIKTCWIKFKAQFLEDNSDFSEQANNIISRCIKELEALIMIEEQYKDCGLLIPSPYEFFLKVIDGKTYTPQTKATGVNIFKYKLTAAANFKFQFVIDSSQKNLEIQNRRLTFLNATKRAKLHLIEDDRIQNSTDVFLKLYAKQTEGADSDFVHFSYAEESFAGYAIAHSRLEEIKKDVPNLDDEDYILAERNYILGRSNKITKLTPEQKNQFSQWSKIKEKTSDSNYHLNHSLENRLKAKTDKDTGLLRVSARGDLEKFFPCPRRWVLQSLLRLQEDTLDTSLMQKYDMGNLNHKILELVLREFENKKLPYYNSEDNEFYLIPENDEHGINQTPVIFTSELFNLILKKTEEALKAPSDFRDSVLALTALTSQKNKLAQKIFSFLQFLLPLFGVDKKGGFGGCTVIAEEKKLSLIKNNLMYYGVIDCLLKTPDGEYIIIDYKNTTGSIPAASEIFIDDNKILGDFQMPLYYKLLEVSDDNLYGGYFYSISDSNKRAVTDKTAKGKSLAEFTPTLEALDEYAKVFEADINAKTFVPKTSTNRKDRQNVKAYEHCTNCPYKTICRTTYTVAGEMIVKTNITNSKSEGGQ